MPDATRPRNVGASVRARLLNLARQKGQALDLLLTRYAIERLLHRLSISPHRDRFALKGERNAGHHLDRLSKRSAGGQVEGAAVQTKYWRRHVV